MSAEQRIQRILLKSRRARALAFELSREIATFFESTPYAVAYKREPDGRMGYYVAKVQPMPEMIAAITGDIVHNLSSALDHLARELHAVASGLDKTYDEMVFPTGTSEAHYRKAAAPYVRGLSAALANDIDRLEPFNGGRGEILAVLQRLDRLERQRLLITAPCAMHSANTGPLIKENGRKQNSAPAGVPHDVKMNFSYVAPIKVGDCVWKDVPDAPPADIRFAVVLHEPEEMKSTRLDEALHSFGAKVEETVNSFRPYL